MRWFLVLIALAACRTEDPRPARTTPPKPELAVKPSSEPAPPAPPEPVRGDRERSCSDVRLSKDELCKCLAGSHRAVSCKLEPLEGSFGVFTPSVHDERLVVYGSEAGMIVVGTLYAFHHARPTNRRIVEVGKQRVLWMEGHGYGSSTDTYAVLCPAREPGASIGIPTCFEIPLRETIDLNASGGERKLATSRLSIALTRRGELEVRAVGKLHDPDLRNYLGRHRLE